MTYPVNTGRAKFDERPREINSRVDSELYGRIEAAMKGTRLTRAEFIRVAIEAYLDDLEEKSGMVG